MKFSAKAILMLALLVAACGAPDGATEDDGTWVGTITVEGNVTTVVNESGSVWGGTAQFVEEASIGVDVGEDPYILASVDSITASDDRIYLLESSPPRVRVYDMDGTHVMDIGSQGQGPGELNTPMSIGLLPDGSLVVRDDRNTRFHVFSPEGELIDDWELPGGSMTSAQMVISPDGTVYTSLPLPNVEARPRHRGWFPYRAGGSRGEPIVFPDLEYETLSLGTITRTRAGGGRSTTTISLPFAPRPVTIMSPVGAMIFGVGTDYRFEVRRLDGTTLIVERRVEPVPVDAGEAEWRRQRTIERTREMDPAWTWNGPDIPGQKPFFSGIYADKNSRVWLLRPGVSNYVPDCGDDPGEQPCWRSTSTTDVFGPDGRFLGTAELPNGSFLAPSAAFISDDMAVLRIEDETGTIMVKRYRLVLPGER